MSSTISAGFARPVRIAFDEHCRWQRILAQSFGNALFQSQSIQAIRVLSDELQRENILRALRKSRGRVDGPAGAAEQLGLRNTTLRSRMEVMKISKSEIFSQSE